MTFEEILDQAIAMLQRRGRVTYRALQRQFNLDDAFLEDLKEELIHGQQLVVDEDGKVLVWSGGADQASAPVPPVALAPAPVPQRAPLSYTPTYLTEKILDCPHAPGRRAQAGHGAVCRHQRLHRIDPGSRPGSRPAAPRPGPAPHDGRRTPLRGHGEPGAGRWHHGSVWRSHRP